MVGQPHPADSTALDVERQASMADEGGASGAVMESEDPSRVPPLFRDDERVPTGTRARKRAAFVFGIAAGAALGLWAYRRH